MRAKNQPLENWPGRAFVGGRKGCIAPIFGDMAKMEAINLPIFALLLAEMALYNVYESVPAFKTRKGPHRSRYSEVIYISILFNGCHYVFILILSN